MKVLSVGNMSGLSNTCLHRHWALEKTADQIDAVNTRKNKISFWFKVANKLFNHGIPIFLPDNSKANSSIKLLIKKAVDSPYDVVWIDKGLTISPKTLRFIKKMSPSTKIVSYSPDNMALRHNQSQNYNLCIPLYDIHFTTKSYIIDAMRSLGAKRIVFTNKHYEQSFHYPRQLTTADIGRLGGDVGFIGVWEKERCESVLYLAANGIKVVVYGDGRWDQYKGVKNLEIRQGIFSEDYSKALQAFKISLCFLRKLNFDLQTSRTMEIPACGGFMLAERTSEHLMLFEEGKEADFFSSDEELLYKCTFYLKNDKIRHEIAKAGRLRCENSGYSNSDSVKRMIKIALSEDVKTTAV